MVLRPLLQSLQGLSEQSLLLKIEELETAIEKNGEQKQVLTNLMASGYLEPALFNKESNELAAEAEALRQEKDGLMCSANGDILQTAPGICSDFTAIGIIFEIGTNMKAFPSAKHLCSWAGLTPTNNESAGKKIVRISKSGCYIKPLLVQCANTVIKSNRTNHRLSRWL